MGCADHATTRPERRYSGVPLGALGGLSHAPLRAVLSPPLGRTSAAHLTSARGSFERTRVHAPRPAPRNGGHSALYALRCREAVAAAKILDPLIQHTWRGLTDHFVTPLGLPMDRVTIDKSGAIVERSVATSPTNIGLYLAALLVQRDRGAVPGPEARARVVTTLATLERLPKDSRGFLFNWYDASDGALRLQSGEGLDASGVQRTANDGAFVSSVDNGNLMIALEGLRHGFRDDPAVTRTIDAVLTPMKLAFSEAFLETETGSLAAGTLRLGYYVRADQRELRTPHHYDRFGSEARSTVALLEAEGYLPEGSLALLGERTSVAEAVVGEERVRVFKAWDGGVFQWLLPNVLLHARCLPLAFVKLTLLHLEWFSYFAFADGKLFLACFLSIFFGLALCVILMYLFYCRHRSFFIKISVRPSRLNEQRVHECDAVLARTSSFLTHWVHFALFGVGIRAGGDVR